MLIECGMHSVRRGSKCVMQRGVPVQAVVELHGFCVNIVHHAGIYCQAGAGGPSQLVLAEPCHQHRIC